MVKRERMGWKSNEKGILIEKPLWRQGETVTQKFPRIHKDDPS